MSAIGKRQRENGQLSKQQYAESIDESSEQAGSFERAPPRTMASRVIVSTRNNRDEFENEYLKQLRVLNQTLAKHVHQELAADAGASLTAELQEYTSNVRTLQDRYQRYSGTVLVCGNSDCGQAGLGEEDEQKNVELLTPIPSLQGRKVTFVACGGLHSAACTGDGRVFTWGCNDDGALGRICATVEAEIFPGEVAIPKGEIIIALDAGDCQTMAVALSGALYGWGSYKDSQGKGFFTLPQEEGSSSSSERTLSKSQAKKIKRKQYQPMRIPGLQGVVQVKCGNSFNIALCRDGSVASWGIGEQKELSRPVCDLKFPQEGDDEPDYDFAGIALQHLTPGPMLLESSEPVPRARAVGCGGYHSFVVTMDASRVYGCGTNQYGQLGLGDRVQRSRLSPAVWLDGWDICAMTGGSHHSLALSANGSVFSFGRSDYGQLGCSDDVPSAGASQCVPRLVPLKGAGGRAAHIACGSSHSLAVTDAHELYSWGLGDNCLLGLKGDADHPRPTRVRLDAQESCKGLRPYDVAGGGAHTLVLALNT